MPFLVRYSTDATPGSTYTVMELQPGPTEVEYPEFREYKVRHTQDHAVVIQRPIKDSRERKWLWKRYREAAPNYEAQWTTLRTLDARQRSIDGKNPVIQIWENETLGEGGFSETTDDQAPDLGGYTNIEWVEVKFLQVSRKSQKGGGIVVFDDSVVTFVVTDPAWENF